MVDASVDTPKDVGSSARMLKRVWIALMALSAATTLAAMAIDARFMPALAGALILLFAFLKTQLILRRYLGLWASGFWRRGFGFALGGYCLLLLGLYLIPAA